MVRYISLFNIVFNPSEFYLWISIYNKQTICLLCCCWANHIGQGHQISGRRASFSSWLEDRPMNLHLGTRSSDCIEWTKRLQYLAHYFFGRLGTATTMANPILFLIPTILVILPRTSCIYLRKLDPWLRSRQEPIYRLDVYCLPSSCGQQRPSPGQTPRIRVSWIWRLSSWGRTQTHVSCFHY